MTKSFGVWITGAVAAQYAAWAFRGYAHLKCCATPESTAAGSTAAVNFPLAIAFGMTALSVVLNYTWLYAVAAEVRRRRGLSFDAPAAAARIFCLVTLFGVLPAMPLIYLGPFDSLAARLWIVS